MKHARGFWMRLSSIGVSSATIFSANSMPTANAQDPPATPLAGTAATVDYPDGSRSRDDYQFVKGAKTLRGGRATMPATEIGAAAARELQSKLAKEFSVMPGQTVRVMSPTQELPAARSDSGAAAAEPAAKLITLHPVEYGGVPLAKGSDYLSIAAEDGRLLVTRKRHLPRKVDAVKPTVTDKVAEAAARKAAAKKFGRDKVNAGTPSLEIWVDSARQGHLAWSLGLSSDSETAPQAYRYWVAATGQPRVLRAENTIYHTHSGRVTGTLWTTTPLQATASRPLAQMSVDRAGSSAITDDDGRYAFIGGGGTGTLASNLSGPNVTIEDRAGPVMNISNSGLPDHPIDLDFDAGTEFERAQVTASFWTNVAHRLAASILDAADLPNLQTRVNIDNACNAFWDGTTMNFFRAGGRCPNTAYSDVVLHEYGHGVDARKGHILDGGYSEGFGDAMAILGTRQSCLGRDFFGAATCLRPATDVIVWPPTPGEGVHAIGRRYAGFTWELIQQLRKTRSEEVAYRVATQLVLAAAVSNPKDIPDAVKLSFIFDAPEADLSSCGWHFRELAAAADSRSIPRPGSCIDRRCTKDCDVVFNECMSSAHTGLERRQCMENRRACKSNCVIQ